MKVWGIGISDCGCGQSFIEWLRRHGVLVRDEEWEIAEDAAAAKAAEDAAAKVAEDAAAAVAKAARDVAAAALKAAEDAAAAKEAEDAAAAAAKAAQDAAAAKEVEDAAAAKEAEEEPPTGMVFMKDGLVPCHDYDVDGDGTPMAVNHPGTFRLCGHGVLLLADSSHSGFYNLCRPSDTTYVTPYSLNQAVTHHQMSVNGCELTYFTRNTD